MRVKQELADLNFGRKETAVYMAALEFGVASASAIAKKAGIQRTNFYDLCPRLLGTGLLSRVSKGKKHFFMAIEPDALVEMQERKLSRLKKILPELNALHNTSGQKPKIFYYDGEDGLNLIYEDTLKYKGEILVFSTPRFFSNSVLYGIN